MPDYFYDMDLVVDPLNPSNVVAKGQVAIYDPADIAGTTLLALKDPSGLPLPNPLTSNANGFLPPRIASVPQTLWKSGGFEGYFNSFKGLRDEAVLAVAAAQGAADAATTAVAEVVTTAAVDGAGALVLTKASGATVNAGNVRGPQGVKGDKGLDGANVLPTDTAIKNAITTPGTATATALSATIHDNIEGGTNPNAIPTVKPAGDTRPGVWEYVHNAKSGYLYHLLAGANFGGSAAILAIGHDADDGTGAALLIAEKANGKGLVIDNRETKTSNTAYGFLATNKSTAAPLVRLEQNVVSAAPALQIVSGAASANQIAVQVVNADGTVGIVYADTGKLMWKRDIEARDRNSSTLARITARADDGVANPSPVHHDRNGLEFQTYAGSGTSYWKKRIFHTGNQLKIQGGATVVGIDTAPAWVDGATFEFNTGTPKVGFLGAAPVAKQTLPAAATDPATTMALANALRTALINLGLAQ